MFFHEFFCVRKVYVNDSKIFGEYKCIGKNHLGSVEHLIVLKEGTRPDSPSKVCCKRHKTLKLVLIWIRFQFDIKGFNSDSVSMDVGARRKLNPGAMDINGYRFELIPDEEFKETRSWTTAHVYEYPTADGKS